MNFFFTLLLPYLQKRFGYGNFLTQMETFDEYTDTFLFGGRNWKIKKRSIKINGVITITLEENGSGDWVPVCAVYSSEYQILAYPGTEDRIELESLVYDYCVTNIDDFETLCQRAIPIDVLPALNSVWRDLLADTCYRALKHTRQSHQVP